MYIVRSTYVARIRTPPPPPQAPRRAAPRRAASSEWQCLEYIYIYIDTSAKNKSQTTTQTMKSTFHKWVLNAMPGPNPSQYSKSIYYQNQKRRIWPEMGNQGMALIRFAIAPFLVGEPPGGHLGAFDGFHCLGREPSTSSLPARLGAELDLDMLDLKQNAGKYTNSKFPRIVGF